MIQRTRILSLHILIVLLFVACVRIVSAQIAGGESGYDKSLEAIEPDAEIAGVGLAGSDPADIGRYLIADNDRARAAELSPDGKTVAFRWYVTGQPQLWIMPTTGGQPHRLTYGSGITFFRWSPSGETLIYGADDDGNEQEAYFAVSVTGDFEHRVLPAVTGGFRVFGDFISANEIVYVSTERNRLDFDFYRANLKNGETNMVREGGLGFYIQEISPDGDLAVVSESVGEDSDNLYLLEIPSGVLTELSSPERRASHTGAGIAWEPDGSGFFLSTNRDRNYSALAFYRLGDDFEIIEAPEADVESVLLCGESGRFLVWSVNEGGYSQLLVRDRQTGGMVDIPPIPEGVYGLHCTPTSDKLAVTVSGWRTPGDIFVLDLDGGDTYHPFKADLAGLVADRLVRPEITTMPARDGVELQGYLYLPDSITRLNSGALEDPPPVVFLVHGGPTNQSRPSFDPIAQYHVDRGLAVFRPNIRGSTGFGHRYVTLDDREKRLDSIRDLVDMLEWLGDNQLVDASRAAVVGGSYGGYAVNAVLSSYPDHFVAGVALFGVSDWVTALEIASPGLKASDRIEYGDISEAKWRRFYEEISPIHNADSIGVPVLYSHGVRDPRIDISETETMVRSLRARGIEAPFIRIPDEGHGWRKLSNRLFYYRYQADFLERVLGTNELSR